MASNICQALGRGVTRTKQGSMRWKRKAAENGHADACLYLAQAMYQDRTAYARTVGLVGEAAGVATSTGVMEGHPVLPDDLTSVWGFGASRRHVVIGLLMCATGFLGTKRAVWDRCWAVVPLALLAVFVFCFWYVCCFFWYVFLILPAQRRSKVGRCRLTG